jgi:hypothetical protein
MAFTKSPGLALSFEWNPTHACPLPASDAISGVYRQQPL